MENKEIIKVAALLALVAALLYRKYFKKDAVKNWKVPKKQTGLLYPSSTESDEYEPYSKKNTKEQ